MAAIEVNISYILTNGYTLEAKQLTAFGNSLNMSDPATTEQHLWYLEDTGEEPFYRLHTRGKGDGQSLDVDPADNTTVLFANTGGYAGQFWRLDASDGGSFKLSNNWTGTDKHLDTYRDTLTPHMAIGDAIGQLWTFSKYAPATSSTSSISTGSASTSSTSSMSTGSASTTASNESVSEKSGMTTGSIAGAIVGGVIGLALVIGAIFFWLRRNRRQRTAKNISGSDLPSPQYAEKMGSQRYAHVLPTSGQGYQQPAELSTSGYPVELDTHQEPIELNNRQEPVELPSKYVR